MFGINRTGRQLRIEAVEQIIANVEEYSDFMAGGEFSYIRNMRSLSECGNHTTFLALARENDVQFLVNSSSGLAHCTIVSNDSALDNQRNTLTLGQIPENHNVSLHVEADTVDLILNAINEQNWIEEGAHIEQAEGDRLEESETEQEGNIQRSMRRTRIF